MRVSPGSRPGRSIVPSRLPGRRTLLFLVLVGASLVSSLAASEAALGAPLTGLLPQYTYITQQLNDRMDLRVNVANGNLVVDAHDLHFNGDGLSLDLDRYYNSLAASSNGRFGFGWSTNASPDVKMVILSDGSAEFHGPSGFVTTFQKNSDGTFQNSPLLGTNATLSTETVGTQTYFALKLVKTEEKYRFRDFGSSIGSLAAHLDKNGHSNTYVADSPSGTDPDVGNWVWNIFPSGHIGSLTSIFRPFPTYTYDGSGNLASYTDLVSGVTHYDYDSSHHLTKITDPVGEATVITYWSGTDQVHTVTRGVDTNNPNGVAVTSFDYTTTRSTCDDANHPDLSSSRATTVTDPDGNETIYCYDTNDRVQKVEDANGHDHFGSFNPNNDLTEYDSGSGSTVEQTKLGYKSSNDAHSPNALSSIQTPEEVANGGSTSLTYDDTSHPYSPTTSTDPQKQQLGYCYDGNGNMSSVQTISQDGSRDCNTSSPLVKLNHDSSYGQTLSGTLTDSIDANGNKTTYTYGQSMSTHDGGLIKSINYPDPNDTVSFGYDGASRVISVKDQEGQTRTYTYDHLDRITRIVFADGAGSTFDTLDFTYDGDGNLKSRTDTPAGGTPTTETFTYDPLNRLATDSPPGRAQLTYAYDPADNLSTFTDGSGITTYSYDDLNRLHKEAEPGGNCDPNRGSVTLCTVFDYDENGNRTRTTYPNGVVIDNTFDKSNRTKTITGTSGSTTLIDYKYTYTDPNTNEDTDLRQTFDDNVANTTTAYQYGKLDRLTDANTSPQSGGSSLDHFTYDYDDNGNVTERTHNGTTTSYGYSTVNELCWSASGSSSPHDCASAPSGATTYNSDSNWNQATSASAGDSFSYNPINQTTSINGTSITYLGPDQSERMSSGGSTFEQGLLGLDSQAVSGTTTYYTRDNKGALVDERTPTARYYYLFDALGSVTALTDATGGIVADYKYEPYGAIEDEHGSVANNFRFAGQFFDTGPGVYKMGVRYYDPNLMRWTQPDTMNQPADVRQADRFAYAGDDPINSTDPNGKDLFGDIGHAIEGTEQLVEGVSIAATSLFIGGVACAAVPESGPAIPFTAASCGAIIVGGTLATAGAVNNSIQSYSEIGS